VCAAAAGLVLACGPSFQAVYECDVRFEHCYALDQEVTAPDAAKKACWRDWLHGYTYGQPRDRVEYAATRFSELSLDPTLPKVETEAPRHAMAVPAPTNAFAPPPNVADHGPPPEGSASAAAPAKSAAPAPVAAHAPGEDCAQSCASYWSACHKTCKDGACEACDKAYRLCVPACFPKR
jgi:hypothetical protein